MNLAAYVRVLRRRWWVIALSALLAVGAAWATAPAQSDPGEPTAAPSGAPQGELYSATHLLLRQPNTVGLEPLNLDLMEHLATREEVRNRVRSALPQPLRPQVATVTVASRPELGLLEVSAGGTEPNAIKRLADTYATELKAFFAERSERVRDEKIATLEARISSIDERLDQISQELAEAPSGSSTEQALEQEEEALGNQRVDLLQQIQQLRTGGVEAHSGLTTLEPATPVPATSQSLADAQQQTGGQQDGTSFQIGPPEDLGPRLALAGLAGLILGVALAFGVDHLDPRLWTSGDAAAAFGLPVLVDVPRRSRRARRRGTLTTVDDPDSAHAEAHRMLQLVVAALRSPADRGSATPTGNGRSRALGVDGAADQDRLPTVALVATERGAGATTTAANLAVAMADQGREVVLVDGDMGQPSLHELFDIDPEPGLAELAADKDAARGLYLCLQRVMDVRGLHLVPAGDPSSAERRRRRVDERLMERLASFGDALVIDGGALMDSSEAASVAAAADVVVVVARSGETSEAAARGVRRRLVQLGVEHAGVVFVGLRARDRSTEGSHPRRLAPPQPAAPSVPGRSRPSGGGRPETVGSGAPAGADDR